MKKPYVICHMMSTINGRIITENWGDKQTKKKYTSLYEKCHNSFDSDGWMCGRVTLEKDFTDGKKPILSKKKEPVARKPFIGDKEAKSFAIAIDAKGKLGWEENNVDGDHIIEVLTEEVKDSYLHYLQSKNISYLFAGKKKLNLASALQQIAKLFPIKTIMLEGGGGMNGSMLSEGLIDEVSLLVLPFADGSTDAASSFDMSHETGKKKIPQMKLDSMEKLDNDVLWLKYKVKG